MLDIHNALLASARSGSIRQARQYGYGLQLPNEKGSARFVARKGAIPGSILALQKALERLRGQRRPRAGASLDPILLFLSEFDSRARLPGIRGFSLDAPAPRPPERVALRRQLWEDLD